MTDSNFSSIIENLSKGDRVRWRNGRIYAVDRVPTGLQTQIRLMEIDGNDVVHISPKMLLNMLLAKEVAFPSTPMSEQNIELRLGDASEQERFDYRYRKAVARELNTIVSGTSRNQQMEILGELTDHYARMAHKQGVSAPKLPTYATAKAWQRELNNNPLSHKSKLLVIDHRKNPRKKRLKPMYLAAMEKTIRDIHDSRANASYLSSYEELRLSCQELHPDRTPEQVDRIMPHYTTWVKAAKEYDAYQSSKARQSPTQHRKDSSHGGKIEVPEVVGGVMELDSTKLNVFVKVDGVNTGIRPWLTVLIDVYTRVITGWYLSLSPPSSVATVNTVLMSSTEHASEKRVIPISLHCDNGPENRNSTIMELASELNFDVRFGAPGYPNDQPHVESNFRSMENRLIHNMGGTSFGKLGQNRPYAAEKFPVYTLDTLRLRLQEFIAIYHQLPHSGLLGMTPDQKWAIATEDPLRQPATITKAYAKSLGLIKVEREINDGIVNAVCLSWKAPNNVSLAKELENSNRKAVLFIDPANLGTAYIAAPNNTKKKFPVYARNKAYQEGLSLEVHESIREWRKSWHEETQDKAGARNLLAQFYRQLRSDADLMMEEVDKGRRKRGDFRDQPGFRAEVSDARTQAPPQPVRRREKRYSSGFAAR
ncbi:DDE-type integrase/transposase/recombinase [Litorivivens sp.]|uniref:DDE-type integrase/transposase/recombinase n=1 Tax=Litorivivens sp. TaxID=2020868 RepID=UPI003564EA3B